MKSFQNLRRLISVRSIHFNLWLGMMALVLMVLVLLWLFQIVFLEEFYTSLHIREVNTKAIETLDRIQGQDEGTIKREIDNFAYANHLSIEWIDQLGNSIYVSGSTGSEGQIPMAKNTARMEAVQSVLNGEQVKMSLLHPRYGNEILILGLPLKSNEEITGAVMINVSLAPVKETTAILKTQLIMITLVLLLAALVISYLLSRNFTKPILEIKKVSKEIAAGNFLSRIDNKKEDEIGELAEAINELGQELTKIEQLRKDLIANVSHELRTPLSLIQGYAETIRDISGDIPEKRQKQLGIIIEESQRLSAIVDDILKLSQLQSGYASLQKTVFSIIETVDSVITRYTGLCEQADIQIGFQSEKNAIVNADRARIEQVLHNLLFNAVNHTPAGGRISVTVVEEVNQVRIEISDTGKGIPEDEIPYIWDRYYKTEKNSGRQAGTGLGLAIVKTILEAHRVPYGIQSTMGEGSTFWFELESGFSL